MDHHDHMHHMDHSSHSGMDHGSPDSAGPMCNMNMLFTWSTDNLCIVFRQWRITSTPSLLVSLALIVTICAGYEALREGIRRYDAVVARRLDTAPRRSPPIVYAWLGREKVKNVDKKLALKNKIGQNRDAVTRRAHYIKAILYGLQNFYAFMIM